MTTAPRKHRYPVNKGFHTLCSQLGVDIGRVMRRAGLPADFLDYETRGLTGQQMFRVWTAFYTEAARDDLPIVVGQRAARGPVQPPLLAFSCSPNVATGLSRLAVFKPLIAPFTMLLADQPQGLVVALTPSEPGLVVPDALAVFEIVYFVECIRFHTGTDFIPRTVTLPRGALSVPGLVDYLGMQPDVGITVSMTLSPEDAQLPLIAAAPEFWEGMEKELRRQLAQKQADGTMAGRVKITLVEILPAGLASIDDVCDRLFVSRRSLQRHLKNEGHSFQAILDETREELSLRYLGNDDLSVDEISYLLAYRDKNSFYRAFHSWTGMTPAQARQSLIQ